MVCSSIPLVFPTKEQQQIDEEIQSLESRIVSLKTRRNLLSPISILPLEIVTTIFLLVRDSSEHKGQAAFTISWVSQQWRYITIHTPSLWTHIDFTRIDWVQLGKHRSGNLLLTINVPDFGSEEDLEFVDVLDGFSRVHSLNLGCKKGWRLPSGWADGPDPTVLRKLVLHKLEASPSFFKALPSLEDMTLIHCKINVSAVCLPPSMTRLWLESRDPWTPYSHGVVLIPYNEIVDLLSTLPNMEILVLRSAISSSSGPPRTAKVKLAKLKTLRLLFGQLPDFTGFLNCLTFTAATTMEFVGRDLNRAFHVTFLHTLQSSSMNTTWNPSSLVLEEDFTEASLSFSGENPSYTIRLRFHSVKGGIEQLVQTTEALGLLNLTQLQSLQFRWDGYARQNPPLRLWRKFSLLPNIQTLQIGGISMSGIIQDWAAGPQDSPLNGANSMASFPALKTLRVDDLPAEEYSILTEALFQRVPHFGRLGKLILLDNDSSVPSSFVDSLEGIADEVEGPAEGVDDEDLVDASDPEE